LCIDFAYNVVYLVNYQFKMSHFIIIKIFINLFDKMIELRYICLLINLSLIFDITAEEYL